MLYCDSVTNYVFEDEQSSRRSIVLEMFNVSMMQPWRYDGAQ